MQKLVGAVLATVAVSGSGQARPVGSEAQPVTSAPSGCVVLLGGGGSMTGNAQVDANWFKIDSAISAAVAARLTARGYDVRPLITDAADANARFKALWMKLSETHCVETVQISHLLRAMQGPLVDAFSIQAEVLKIDIPQDGSRVVKPVSLYSKTYDYPMSQDVMEHLSLSGLGTTIADGVASSGVLPKR